MAGTHMLLSWFVTHAVALRTTTNMQHTSQGLLTNLITKIGRVPLYNKSGHDSDPGPEKTKYLNRKRCGALMLQGGMACIRKRNENNNTQLSLTSCSHEEVAADVTMNTLCIEIGSTYCCCRWIQLNN